MGQENFPEYENTKKEYMHILIESQSLRLPEQFLNH